MWNTLGFGSQEVELMYDIRQNMFAESQMIKGITDRTQELVRLSNDYIKKGDLTSAQDVANQINSLQAPLTVEQRRKIYYLSRESYRSMGESAILQDRKTAQSGLSSQYERLVKGRGQE
jgi:PHD/YefM family antitoxin component YafN of YafNO toxin-antitoxin module